MTAKSGPEWVGMESNPSMAPAPGTGPSQKDERLREGSDLRAGLADVMAMAKVAPSTESGSSAVTRRW